MNTGELLPASWGSKTQIVGLTGRDEFAGPDLVDALSLELAERWQAGDEVLAEELLGRHPELVSDMQALRLIYEEVCLRKEAGEANAADLLMLRFPQWQSQLAFLLDCEQAVVGNGTPQTKLRVGQTIAGYTLKAELGRGGQGRVFLATQAELAERPVVVKFSPCLGEEHLSLARLQHTHIVPLYGWHDAPDENRRLLCMPYLGGTTLAVLLQMLSRKSVKGVRMDGRELLRALDDADAGLPCAVARRGMTRAWISTNSYENVIAWFGSCLADALRYAHERGLVHFDLTAANVLVTAEGMPMLLDFHLARKPLEVGSTGAEWLGGTPGYMAPEQVEAFQAIQAGLPVQRAVDERADVYALGVVLYQALGGKIDQELGARPLPPLRRRAHDVSVGLGDIVDRCVATCPTDRYPSAVALAEDLRRHLSGLPLQGVKNRSWVERYVKWRKRSPFALALYLAAFALVAVSVGGLDYWRQQHLFAKGELAKGEELLEVQEVNRARDHFQRARVAVGSGLLQRDLARAIECADNRASSLFRNLQWEQAGARKRELIRHLRNAILFDALSKKEGRKLEGVCEALWHNDGCKASLSFEDRQDLVDLGVIWGKVLVLRLPTMEGRRTAYTILQSVREQCGSSAALEWELSQLRRELALPIESEQTYPCRGWDRLVIGKSLLCSGELERAYVQLSLAVEEDPKEFWAHYYLGFVHSRRKQFSEALACMNVCVALSPDRGPVYYNRGRLRAAQGDHEGARRDYTKALHHEPTLLGARWQRGILLLVAGRFQEVGKNFAPLMGLQSEGSDSRETSNVSGN